MTDLLTENARLRAALVPFAKAGELFAGTKKDQTWTAVLYNPAAGKDYQITEDHVRDAYAALAMPAPDAVQEIVAEATQWQPIETAPKDGTRFLSFGGGLDHVDVCTYNENIGCWNCTEYILDDVDDEPDGYNRPTHWMPLPAPPSAIRARGEGQPQEKGE